MIFIDIVQKHVVHPSYDIAYRGPQFQKLICWRGFFGEREGQGQFLNDPLCVL